MEFVFDAFLGILSFFYGLLAMSFWMFIWIVIIWAIPYGFMMACIKNPLMDLLVKRFNLKNDDPDDNDLTKIDFAGAGLGCFAILMFLLGMYLSYTYLIPFLF